MSSLEKLRSNFVIHTQRYVEELTKTIENNIDYFDEVLPKFDNEIEYSLEGESNISGIYGVTNAGQLQVEFDLGTRVILTEIPLSAVKLSSIIELDNYIINLKQ